MAAAASTGAKWRQHGQAQGLKQSGHVLESRFKAPTDRSGLKKCRLLSKSTPESTSHSWWATFPSPPQWQMPLLGLEKRFASESSSEAGEEADPKQKAFTCAALQELDEGNRKECKNDKKIDQLMGQRVVRHAARRVLRQERAKDPFLFFRKSKAPCVSLPPSHLNQI